MLQIECISDELQLANLQQKWGELWSQSPSQSFFLTYDWTRCCWEELRAGNELRVFIVKDAGKVLLIAPLMKSRRAERGLPANCLTFIDHPEAQIADLLSCSQDLEGRALNELLRYLLRECADWHLLSLDKLPEQSATAHHLRKIAASSHSCIELKLSHEAFCIPLRATWEQYLSSRSPRFRKTLRNITNRVDRLGTKVEVIRYAGAQLDPDVLHRVFSVSDSSWKLGDGVAMTSQQSRMHFFEQIVLNSAQRAAVQIWLLKIDSVPIASEMQVIDGPIAYALRSDYDDRYADYSPGVYLQVEILKHLFDSQQEIYNLGVGLNPYKARWADKRISLVNFRTYNQSLYSRFLKSVHRYDLTQWDRVPGFRSVHGFFSGKLS